MYWDDFYCNFCEWSETTIKSRISSLTNIGEGCEVVDAILTISDKKIKAQLARKALKLGVKFTHDDFVCLIDELPDDLFAEIAKRGNFNLDNPYFDENDFDWDDFYGEYCNMPADMLKRCISRITKFGDSEEVKDVICFIDDTDIANALYGKALLNGVKFTKSQVQEIEQSTELFLIDDIKRIINMSDSDIQEWAHSIGKSNQRSNTSFWHAGHNHTFLAIVVGVILGLSDGVEKKHSGRCEGDCEKCPAHYGYRYGRWYYGRDHHRGCVFGGNRGRGALN